MLPYTPADALEAMARAGYAEDAPTWAALLPGGEPGPREARGSTGGRWRRIVGGFVRRNAAGPRGHIATWVHGGGER